MRTYTTMLALFFYLSTNAQSQDLVKLDNEPIDFSNPWNIVLYIVFPILLTIFYIRWSIGKRREREEQQRNKKDNSDGN